MYSSSITCQPKFPRRVTDLQLIFPQRTVRINTCTLIVAQTQLQTACCHANVPNFAKTQSRARRRCAVMHTTPSSTRNSATACLVKSDGVFFFQLLQIALLVHHTLKVTVDDELTKWDELSVNLTPYVN